MIHYAGTLTRRPNQTACRAISPQATTVRWYATDCAACKTTLHGLIITDGTRTGEIVYVLHDLVTIRLGSAQTLSVNFAILDDVWCLVPFCTTATEHRPEGGCPGVDTGERWVHGAIIDMEAAAYVEDARRYPRTPGVGDRVVLRGDPSAVAGRIESIRRDGSGLVWARVVWGVDWERLTRPMSIELSKLVHARCDPEFPCAVCRAPLDPIERPDDFDGDGTDPGCQNPI